MSKEESTSDRLSQDGLYQDAIDGYGPALGRLARGYEADPEKRRALLQEIHLQLWLSFKHFDGRCSMRTWIYRVAHNCGASYVRRLKPTDRQVILLYLEGLDGVSIGEVTGISPANVAVKVSRIKRILAHRFTDAIRPRSLAGEFKFQDCLAFSLNELQRNLACSRRGGFVMAGLILFTIVDVSIMGAREIGELSRVR